MWGGGLTESPGPTLALRLDGAGLSGASEVPEEAEEGEWSLEPGQRAERGCAQGGWEQEDEYVLGDVGGF